MKVRANGLSLPDLDTLAAIESSSPLFMPPGVLGRNWTPTKRPGEPLYRPAVNNGYWAEDIITNGLVLYVPCWLYSGKKFPSVDAYKHTCTVTGAAWGLQGRTFGGVSDYIALGTNTALKLEDGTALSYILWVYVHTLQDAMLVGAVTSATDSLGVGLQGGGANFRLNKFGVEYAPASFNVPANTRTCLGVSYTINSDLVYYKNGAAITTTTWAQTFTSAAQKTLGGHYFSGSLSQPFDGVIGEVFGFNRFLTAAEHAHVYNTTRWRYA